MQPVVKVQIMLQRSFGLYLLCFGTFVVVFVTTSAIDMLSTPSGDGCRMQYTLWGVSVTMSLMVLIGYTMQVSLFLLPWLYNYPHPVHGPSWGALLGEVGYDVRKELLTTLALGYGHIPCFVVVLFAVTDLSAFSEPSGRIFSVYTVYEFGTICPGVSAAPVAYFAVIASLHFVSMHWAVDAAHATWHMWQSGLHMLTSPDSKSATVVSFDVHLMHRPTHGSRAHSVRVCGSCM